MSVHQCPKCELRFTWLTELEDHCRTDHAGFHHDYPVHGVHRWGDDPATHAAETAAAHVEPAGDHTD